MANGEGSSSSGPGRSGSSTLSEVMRAPSINAPEVVVLDELSSPSAYDRREILDPREDLWLSSADGRYNSPIIPVRVGTAPYQEIFQIHKNVIMRAEWFRKALDGGFQESHSQSLELPEEEPGIFHFIVAYLYENRYVPTKPLSSVLIPDPEKGKSRENANNSDDESDSSSVASFVSDSTARSRRRRERRRRRDDRHFERLRQKHPGMHRPQCNCPQCLNSNGPPCWSCSAPRVPPPLPPPMPPPGAVVVPGGRGSRPHRRGPDGRMPPPPPVSPPVASADAGRIKGEDMRTWLMTYELNLDVYICANKFLMDDFKEHVSRATIDMLETAGGDAAHIEVLHLCRKLYAGLSEKDSLLKMVFARVGFLQSILWRRAPEETNEFLVTNPEVGALMLKETATRREDDFPSGRMLPSMERPWFSPPMHVDHGGPYHHRPPHPRGHQQRYYV